MRRSLLNEVMFQAMAASAGGNLGMAASANAALLAQAAAANHHHHHQQQQQHNVHTHQSSPAQAAALVSSLIPTATATAVNPSTPVQPNQAAAIHQHLHQLATAAQVSLPDTCLIQYLLSD